MQIIIFKSENFKNKVNYNINKIFQKKRHYKEFKTKINNEDDTSSSFGSSFNIK